MRLTVSVSQHESLPILPGRHYLKSLSGDPAEPVDEAEYLDEVEREAIEFFCHEHINLLPVSDTVDINLTIRIPQMAHSRKQKSRYCYYHPPHALVQFGICFEHFIKIID